MGARCFLNTPLKAEEGGAFQGRLGKRHGGQWPLTPQWPQPQVRWLAATQVPFASLSHHRERRESRARATLPRAAMRTPAGTPAALRVTSHVAPRAAPRAARRAVPRAAPLGAHLAALHAGTGTRGATAHAATARGTATVPGGTAALGTRSAPPETRTWSECWKVWRGWRRCHVCWRTSLCKCRL